MLFLKLIGASLRSQMQYPTSFLMLSGSHFIGTFIDFLGVWILFDRFKIVEGWTFSEVGLIYGSIHMGFALSEAFSRGFDKFSQMVKQGDFDRLLLRPINPFFQVAAREVQAMRVGRFLQGLIVLLMSAKALEFSLFSIHAFMIFLSILGTACLFYGLFVIQATVSFWTIATFEIMNITTYGGLETGQYPMSIYRPFFRWIFTFLIPIGCIAYYPIATFLHHETLSFWLGSLLPLSGGVFLFLAYQFWHFGVRHYRSTGS